MHTHMYVHTHHTHTHTTTYTHTHTHTRTHTRTTTYTHTYTHTHAHMYTTTYAHTFTYTCTHAHMHTTNLPDCTCEHYYSLTVVQYSTKHTVLHLIRTMRRSCVMPCALSSPSAVVLRETASVSSTESEFPPSPDTLHRHNQKENSSKQRAVSMHSRGTTCHLRKKDACHPSRIQKCPNTL